WVAIVRLLCSNRPRPIQLCRCVPQSRTRRGIPRSAKPTSPIRKCTRKRIEPDPYGGSGCASHGGRAEARPLPSCQWFGDGRGPSNDGSADEAPMGLEVPVMPCQLFSDDGRAPSKGVTAGSAAGGAAFIMPDQLPYEDARGPSWAKAASGAA